MENSSLSAEQRSDLSKRERLERKVDADSVAYALARRKYDEGLMDVLDLRKSADNWFASQAELVRCRLLFDLKRRLANYYITNKIFD